MEFNEFPKIPRLNRTCVVTEKLDGTNGVIHIEPLRDGLASGTYVPGSDLVVIAGSRTRWITVEDDNYGFARWVHENAAELAAKLGAGTHYGEWWGGGIQRGYGLAKTDKRFSLFNVARWRDPLVRPECCGVVPVLYEGAFSTVVADNELAGLRAHGSHAVPGFMKPEGIVLYHNAANICFKATCERDEEHKTQEPKKERVARAPRDPSKGGRRKEQLPFEGADRRKAA